MVGEMPSTRCRRVRYMAPANANSNATGQHEARQAMAETQLSVGSDDIFGKFHGAGKVELNG